MRFPVLRFLGGGRWRGVFFGEGRVGDGAVYGDGGGGGAVEGGVGCEGAVGPFSGGRVVAEEEEAEGDEDDEDAGDDEGDAPGFVGGDVLLGHEAVVYGGHDEVGYSAAEVTQAAGEGVGSAFAEC